MRRYATLLALAGLLAAATVHGAEDPKSAEDLEARLAAARERLAAAAREVAELTTELSGPLADRLMVLTEGPRRAIIGVQLDPASGPAGARVQEVSPGGPAAEAGIRPGDVIVALNGRDLQGENAARELTRRMREIEPDSKVKLRIVRDGKPQDVELTARRAMRHSLRVPAPPLPPGFELDGEPLVHALRLRRELGGMELATLTPGLGRYFGTERGVLVVRAPEQDLFELQDGDVILSIDGREPRNGSHATRILGSYQPGEKVSLRVMRDRKPLTLDVVVPGGGERKG